ncbi:DEAD-box ATP-dependent RNA helicase 39 [Porphyridium purpureum]|uniref:DEAD-box ATP-dependent RNA helicase 39 n=1 Tax=Porphyridium purpureum TaxID=35688 RepID=A0A5J4YKV9_PORPP|nr:DEAD-box ATP-dependent RNA helicase 39 [Porphyridium purpureum]|eukprot:POR1180..scf210_14
MAFVSLTVGVADAGARGRGRGGAGLVRDVGLCDGGRVGRVIAVRRREAVQTRMCTEGATIAEEIPAAVEELRGSLPAAPHEAVDEAFFSAHLNGFGALGIGQPLCDALAQGGVSRPSVIQARGIVPALAGASVIIGAATGSGKTLAYLLPIIQRIKNSEALQVLPNDGMDAEDDLDSFMDGSAEPATRARAQRAPRRPRAIIMLPTRELGQQVFEVAKQLSHFEKCRVVSLLGGASGLKAQTDALARAPVDIVVTTSGRLLQHLEKNTIDLVETEVIVLDEVDTMFDEGFGPELERVFGRLRRRLRSGTQAKEMSTDVQFIAVGATHPKAAEELYQVHFPNAKRINVDLHRTPKGLTQRFINVKPNEKTAELLSFLGNSASKAALRGGRMIMFTNSIESCRFVDHFLSEHGFSTSCMHGKIPAETRAANFQQFKSGVTQILVCTDIAARGLDNLAVDHVVMFDFPTTAVDYIHRAGRTARAGRAGLVTSLVTKKDERLAKVLELNSRVREDALEKELEKRNEWIRAKQASEVALKKQLKSTPETSASTVVATENSRNPRSAGRPQRAAVPGRSTGSARFNKARGTSKSGGASSRFGGNRGGRSR